jgi:hypothetical protein
MRFGNDREISPAPLSQTTLFGVILSQMTIKFLCVPMANAEAPATKMKVSNKWTSFSVSDDNSPSDTGGFSVSDNFHTGADAL